MWEEKPDDHIVQSSPPASIYIDYFLVERMVETACTKKKPSEINHLASILAERASAGIEFLKVSSHLLSLR